MTPWGSHLSAEHRAKISTSLIGKIKSPETRAKMSVARVGHIGNVGHITSLETRVKISIANKGKRSGPLSHNWRGGMKAMIRRIIARRRLLGFVPLNAWFPGSDGHHVDTEQVIYMPHNLHHSIYHNQRTGRGMAAINAVAYNFLFKQEIEAAMAAQEVAE